MSKSFDKAEPVSKDMAAVEPGCPHCGAMTAHPSSSRPVAMTSSSIVVAARSVPAARPKKDESPAALRPDGKFAYELFLEHMGHKDVAVSWEKLTGKAQRVWTGVAHGLERRTIDALLAERARHERESKR